MSRYGGKVLAAGGALAVAVFLACGKDYGEADPPTATLPAGSEAGTPDVASLLEAGPMVGLDAPVGPDADILGAPATLADDFERGNVPLGGPLALGIVPPGAKTTTALCGNAAPPDACSGTTIRLASASGSTGAIYLTTALSSQQRRMRFDFGASILVDDPHAQMQFASIELANGHVIVLDVHEGRVRLGDQDASPDGTYSNDFVDVAALVSGWTRFQLFVDLDAALAEIVTEGTVLATKTLRPEVASERLVAARVGIPYTAGANIVVYVDNLGLTYF